MATITLHYDILHGDNDDDYDDNADELLCQGTEVEMAKGSEENNFKQLQNIQYFR